MRKFYLFCILVTVATAWTCMGQTPVDHFEVGPYIVDYNGKGNIKYRLQENIDLYDFFELKKDTTIIPTATEIPVKQALQLNARTASSISSSKDLGIEVLWKRHILDYIYFNGGVSLLWGYHVLHYKDNSLKLDNVLEIGIPLQIEFGKLNRQRASLYGSAGITPAFFSTADAIQSVFRKGTGTDPRHDTGFLVIPGVEFGGNIPVCNKIMRIGIYGEYKISCTRGAYGSCKDYIANTFIGIKAGIIL